jgi:hypothetical protein
VTALVRYNAMRTALANCARIDEVMEIALQADRLAAYAALMNDLQAEIDAKEIRGRAGIQFGVLSRDLEVSEQSKGGRHPNDGKPTKADQLAAVGVSTSAAHRMEQLTGADRGEAGRSVVTAAAEAYFSRAREDGEPASIGGLRTAIREALLDQLGPPDKVVTFRTKPDPLADQLADFGAAISAISQIPENDMAAMAESVQHELVGWHEEKCTAARMRISRFLAALEIEHAA